MSDERDAAERIIETIERKLPKWRSWFPSEESEVEIRRRDLLALVEMAKLGIASSQDDAQDAARFRFIRDYKATIGSCKMDGQHYWLLGSSGWPQLIGRTFEEAVDGAMELVEREKKGGES